MMFRLTAFLLAGLYLALLIGGADRGQLRFGLRDAPVAAVATPEAEVTAVAETPAERAAPVRTVAVSAAAPLPQGVAAMPLVDPDSFQPEQGTEVFSLANTNTGLMDLVPDEEAAAALSSGAEPAAEPAPKEWAVVTAAAVNVRTGPSTANDLAGRLVQGDEVLLVGPETDGWVQVRVEGDGIDGFVAARFLAPRTGE